MNIHEALGRITIEAFNQGDYFSWGALEDTILELSKMSVSTSTDFYAVLKTLYADNLRLRENQGKVNLYHLENIFKKSKTRFREEAYEILKIELEVEEKFSIKDIEKKWWKVVRRLYSRENGKNRKKGEKNE